jgi:hypothetical protein
MPDQIGRVLRAESPVMGDGRDPAQRVIGVRPGGVHLTDDVVLGAGHLGQRRQCRQHPVPAVPVTNRLQLAGRFGEPQFCCLGEQFGHIAESSIVHRSGVQVHQIGQCQPVGDGEAHR